MKIFASIIVSILIASCASEPFQGNKDNPYLVGKWTIVEVDDADALVHQEAFLNNIVNEQFQKNDILEFKKGPDFQLYNSENNSKIDGKYALAEENKVLKIQLEDERVIEYAITEESTNKLKLDVTTAGEVVNLVIEKQ
jgi:hypothetical protein